jgi:hypothetical protein
VGNRIAATSKDSQTIGNIFSENRLFNHFQRHFNYRPLLQRSQPNLFYRPQIAFGADTRRAYIAFSEGNKLEK